MTMKTGNIVACWTLLIALGAMLPGQVYAQKDLSWDMLDDLEYVETDGEWGLEFGEDVKKLDGKSVKIMGFMMPLESTLEQSHFILSMLPLDGCQFCAPGTQAQFLEVKVSPGNGIRYTYDAIEIAGILELIPDAPMGVYFLIKDAKEIQ